MQLVGVLKLVNQQQVKITCNAFADRFVLRVAYERVGARQQVIEQWIYELSPTRRLAFGSLAFLSGSGFGGVLCAWLLGRRQRLSLKCSTTFCKPGIK